MHLTTKSRYAIIAMIDIAINAKSEVPVSLSDISIRQNITLRYLEQIFSKLKKAHLVVATKGPGGGYQLSANATDINLLAVIKAVEENLRITKCVNRGLGCHTKGVKCMTHYLWNGLENRITEYFQAISIYDICKNNILRLEHA